MLALSSTYKLNRLAALAFLVGSLLLGSSAPESSGSSIGSRGSLAQQESRPLSLTERQAQVASGKYALVIGIDSYASADIAPLRYSEADARSVADVLIRRCGFPAANVDLLLGSAATQEAILTRLDAMSNTRLYQGHDTLLFYFSGHGGLIEGRGKGDNAAGTRDNYLIPYDGSTNPAVVQLKNIPLEQVKLMLDRSVFQRKVVLVDACRNELHLGARGSSSSFDASTWADRYGSARGMKLIVSTQSGQVSWEDPKLGHGVFTHYMLEGLRGHAADEQGVVTVGRLAEYIEQGMSAYSRKNPQRLQLPTLLGEGMVNIPLAVAGLSAVDDTAPAEPAAPRPLPEMELTVLGEMPYFMMQDILTDAYDVHSFCNDENPVVLFAFWQTDCPPCNNLLNQLKRIKVELYNELKIVIISRDTPLTVHRVAPFFARHDYPFTVLVDPEQGLNNKLGLKAAPAVYVVNKDKEILYKKDGYLPGYEKELESAISSALALAAQD